MSSIFRDTPLDYDYSRVNYIDRGADGHVYKAIDLQTSRVVAIRVLEKRDPYDLYRPSELLALQQDFVDEVTLAATLKHPHIVDILAVYFRDATNIKNLVVRELMIGTLTDYLSREDASQWRDGGHAMGIPHKTCCDVAFQLCQAVAHMHGLGISHRNLNPDTILLARDDPPFIKVSGLGWSERYEPLNIAVCVSPRAPGWDEYLAPEIVVPRAPDYTSDMRADSWGLGVVLFRMLLLKSAWRELRQGYDSASHLRWDELEARLIPESVVDDVPVVDDAVLAADDGSHASEPADVPEEAPADLNPSPANFPILANCLHFMRQLLRDVPATRMSIEDALVHPWLQTHTPVYPDIEDEERKAPSPHPTFPEDIERTINEVVLNDTRRMCGTMKLVASRFETWTKPIMFHTAVVRRRDNWMQRVEECLLPNGSLIRILVLDLGLRGSEGYYCQDPLHRKKSSEKELSLLRRLLEACGQVNHLAVTWNVWDQLQGECGALRLKSLYLIWDGTFGNDAPSLDHLQHPADLEDLTLSAWRSTNDPL
ncbi:kinase-like domain-containing protein [Mycena polygramma]|nr:kinase-like domain-containing protein [Mycena polygramma]